MLYLPAIDQERYAHMSLAQLRDAFLVRGLFEPGKVSLRHWETERTIVGGVVPPEGGCALPNPPGLAAAFFTERREIGIINIGQPGRIVIDGRAHELGNLDCLYVGRGSRQVLFESDDPQRPAQYYLLSYPAHAGHPTTLVTRAQTTPVELGTPDKGNRRSIYKYILPGGIASCQLVMGLTVLKPGNLWNTMPPHTHLRRSEVYLYFDLPDNELAFHFAGRPEETRSLVVRDREVVLSPPWSVHCGVGTSSYAFVWGMGGENQDFSDMDPAEVGSLG